MAFQRTFRRSGDHHADYYALDGVEIKIGEAFKPPRKVTLPVGWHQKDPSNVLSLTYDFSLERQTIKKIENERLEKQRKEDEERAKLEEKENAKILENGNKEQVSTSMTISTSSSNSIFSNVGTDILVPTAVTNFGHKRNESFGKNAIDFSDFEGNATSPFELVELQTINDMDELKSCFQPHLATSAISSANKSNTNSITSSPASRVIETATPTIATRSSYAGDSSIETGELIVRSLRSKSLSAAAQDAVQRNLDLSNSVSNQLPRYSSAQINSAAETQMPVNGKLKSELSKSVPDLTSSALIDVTDSPRGNDSWHAPIATTPSQPPQTQISQAAAGLPYSTRQTTYLSDAYKIPNEKIYTNSVPNISSPPYRNATVPSNSVAGNVHNIPSSYPSKVEHFGAPRSYMNAGQIPHNMGDTLQSYNPFSNALSASSSSQTGLPVAQSNAYTIPPQQQIPNTSATSYSTGFQMSQHDRNTQLPPLENVATTGPQAPPIPFRHYQSPSPNGVGRNIATSPVQTVVPTSSDPSPTPPLGYMSPVSPPGFGNASTFTRPDYTTVDQHSSFDSSNVKRRTAQRRSNLEPNARMKRHSSPLPPIGLQDSTNNEETSWYQSSLPDPQPLLSETDKKFVVSVSSMGFPAPRVARAVQKFGQKEREVFDFLFLVEELCKAGHSGDDSEVALTRNDMKKPKALEFLELVKTFKELGFKEENIHEALAAADNDSDKALDYLTTGI